MYTTKTVTIISAHDNSLSTTVNTWRALRLQKDLREAVYQRAVGRYNGHEEISFIVSTPGGTMGQFWQSLVVLAKRYGQESVLHVDANQQAALYFIEDGTWQHLGPYVQVTETEALSLGSYTKTEEGLYYAAK